VATADESKQESFSMTDTSEVAGKINNLRFSAP